MGGRRILISDRPKQFFMAETEPKPKTETINKLKFMFLCITKSLQTNFTLEKHP